MIQGRYQVVTPPPFTVGGEVTGIIEAVGSNVSGWEVGELCCCSGGGFAEQVRVPAHSLIKLPQDFDVRDFPSPYGYQTAVFALQHRGMLQAGETLLVLGAAGGVGITTVEIGKSMGATVIAAASTDEKLEECRKMGADHLINYSGLDYKGLRDAIRDAAPNGVDVVFDPVRRAREKTIAQTWGPFNFAHCRREWVPAGGRRVHGALRPEPGGERAVPGGRLRSRRHSRRASQSRPHEVRHRNPCTPDAFASKVTVMNVAAETPRWWGRRGVTGR